MIENAFLRVFSKQTSIWTVCGVFNASFDIWQLHFGEMDKLFQMFESICNPTLCFYE